MHLNLRTQWKNLVSKLKWAASGESGRKIKILLFGPLLVFLLGVYQLTGFSGPSIINLDFVVGFWVVVFSGHSISKVLDLRGEFEIPKPFKNITFTFLMISIFALVFIALVSTAKLDNEVIEMTAFAGLLVLFSEIFVPLVVLYGVQNRNTMGDIELSNIPIISSIPGLESMNVEVFTVVIFLLFLVRYFRGIDDYVSFREALKSSIEFFTDDPIKALWLCVKYKLVSTYYSSGIFYLAILLG